LRYYPGICLEEGLREITKTSFSIVGLWAEIRTCDLPNMKQKYYALDHNVGYE
jgi:hypothetical protein